MASPATMNTAMGSTTSQAFSAMSGFKFNSDAITRMAMLSHRSSTPYATSVSR
jgi:hypothetical protein